VIEANSGQSPAAQCACAVS